MLCFVVSLQHYSSSESSSSSDEDESRRSRSSSKRSKKEKKHKSSRDKHSSKSKDETDGPVPLSRFFGNLKDWHKQTCKRTITRASKIVFDQNTPIRIWQLSSLLQCYIFDDSSCIVICWIEICNNAHIINQVFFQLICLKLRIDNNEKKKFIGRI